jgi:hypothetical protein
MIEISEFPAAFNRYLISNISDFMQKYNIPALQYENSFQLFGKLMKYIKESPKKVVIHFAILSIN